MINGFSGSLLSQALAYKVKPKIFISYHHGGDQSFYNKLSSIISSDYVAIQDKSLDRKIDSNDAEYVMRRIREDYLSGTSCTVVLCGLQTPYRKFVDWEIKASLDKQHALVGLWLPTLPLSSCGGTDKPGRLQDNIDSGYAVWGAYADVISDPAHLKYLIHSARDKSKILISNSRAMRDRNG